MGNTPTSLSWRVPSRLFRSGSAAFCVNYMAVRLYSSCASLCVSDQRLRIDESPPLIHNATSLCERGYSQPPQVILLPVWDDASTQIIHVNDFMSSITLTRRPSPTLLTRTLQLGPLYIYGMDTLPTELLGSHIQIFKSIIQALLKNFRLAMPLPLHQNCYKCNWEK